MTQDQQDRFDAILAESSDPGTEPDDAPPDTTRTTYPADYFEQN